MHSMTVLFKMHLKIKENNRKQIQHLIKEIVYHDHVKFVLEMQYWFHIRSSSNVKHYISKFKEKKFI